MWTKLRRFPGAQSAHSRHLRGLGDGNRRSFPVQQQILVHIEIQDLSAWASLLGNGSKTCEALSSTGTVAPSPGSNLL